MSVIDHFATLGFERTPVLDEAAVRERFHERSREVHPDADSGDEEQFAAINEAQRVLRSPSARLRHLLELEHEREGRFDWQHVCGTDGAVCGCGRRAEQGG